MPSIDPRLINLAIQEAPAIIEAFRRLFVRRATNAPTPTDAEVIAAFNQAFLSSLLKDQLWLAAHPEQP